MVINLEIGEFVAALKHSSKAAGRSEPLASFRDEDWCEVIQALCIDAVRERAKYGRFRKGDSLTETAVLRLISKYSDKGEITGEDREYAEEIECWLLDDYWLEIFSSLKSMVKPKTVWAVTCHRAFIRIEYVGNGKLLEAAIRAAGGDFEEFIRQFY